MSIAQPVENWQSSIERGKEKSIRDDIVAKDSWIDFCSRKRRGRGDSYSQREGREAIGLSTGRYISRDFLGRGWRGRRNSIGRDRLSEMVGAWTLILSKLSQKYHRVSMYTGKWPSPVFVCRACMHSFFIDCQSLRELRITSVLRNAAI